METIRVVFYHTKEILKGKGLRMYALLFAVSMIVMLYTETLQLLMNVEGTAYMVVSFFSSIVNIVVNYIVLYIFIKAVRNEKFGLQDIRYGLTKVPMFIVLGLLLSLLQIALFTVCAFFGGLMPVYFVLYTIVYTIFVIWNGVVAFGTYDDAKFSELLSSGIRILKDHVGELFVAALALMIWRVLTQLFVPYLIKMILGDVMYAGMIIPSIIKGADIGGSALLMATFVNLIYYAVQYACLLPLYTYLAKLYDENKKQYVPSAKRLLLDNKKA